MLYHIYGNISQLCSTDWMLANGLARVFGKAREVLAGFSEKVFGVCGCKRLQRVVKIKNGEIVEVHWEKCFDSTHCGQVICLECCQSMSLMSYGVYVDISAGKAFRVDERSLYAYSHRSGC